MKNYILFIVCAVLMSMSAGAQLKTTAICPEFNIDILDGKVNGQLLPTSTVGQIKERFPCFTSTEDESTTAKCGGGVFFKDKDIYFYTGRNYIEIGPKFKGKLTVPLMSVARNNLFKKLGNPILKDVSWDAFQTSYGIIILYYGKDTKVNKIQFSTEGTNTIKLCE
jgi:hypothetical protein